MDVYCGFGVACRTVWRVRHCFRQTPMPHAIQFYNKHVKFFYTQAHTHFINVACVHITCNFIYILPIHLNQISRVNLEVWSKHLSGVDSLSERNFRSSINLISLDAIDSEKSQNSPPFGTGSDFDEISPRRTLYTTYLLLYLLLCILSTEVTCLIDGNHPQQSWTTPLPHLILVG